jgi:hypothetical protein
MHTGRTLQNLAQIVQHQAETRRDFIADPRALSVTLDEVAAETVRHRLSLGNADTVALSQIAHDQLATYLDMPRDYYLRSRAQAPALFQNEVNTWLAKMDPKAKRMVRIIAGTDGRPMARAILSDKYRPLDNYDLLTAILPQMQAHDLEILSCDITESRLYLKAVSRSVTGEVTKTRGAGDHQFYKSDKVRAGVIIQNSEVGHGSLSVKPLVFTEWCTNGAIMELVAMRANHVGKKHRSGADMGEGQGSGIGEILSTEAKQADDAALFLKVRDVVKHSLDSAAFAKTVEQLNVTAGRTIDTKADVPALVEAVGERFQLAEGERKGILAHLIKGGDLTQWGLASAITSAAQDVVSYDRSTELEAIGGKLHQADAGLWNGLVSLAMPSAN